MIVDYEGYVESKICIYVFPPDLSILTFGQGKKGSSGLSRVRNSVKLDTVAKP